MTQADIEARAMLDAKFGHGTAGTSLLVGGIENYQKIIAAMLAFRAEARREAFVEAAEVARGAWHPSYVRGYLPDADKWEPGSPWDRGAVDACNRIAAAIAEQGRLG